MTIRSLRKIATNIIGTFLIIFIFTGCATYAYLLRSEQKRAFNTSGVSYNEAFSKAIKTAAEIGLSVITSDKESGTFLAQRGGGLGEITEMSFFLEEDHGNLNFIVKAKSSKGGENFINEFISAYGKYVKINQKGEGRQLEQQVTEEKKKEGNVQEVSSQEIKTTESSKTAESLKETKPSKLSLQVISSGNVRSTPSTSSKIIAKVKKGEMLQGQGKSGDWYIITLPSGESGWVFKGLVKMVD